MDDDGFGDVDFDLSLDFPHTRDMSLFKTDESKVSVLVFITEEVIFSTSMSTTDGCSSACLPVLLVLLPALSGLCISTSLLKVNRGRPLAMISSSSGRATSLLLVCSAET